MSVVFKDEIRQARKVYLCDACATWCGASYGPVDCADADELLIYEAALADRFKILRGQKYRYVCGVSEGSMFTFRARIGMDSMCQAHGLYEE